MMRVLHITTWYPNRQEPHEAPFIARHIASLAPHATNTVWHIAVRGGKPWAFERKSTIADRTYVLDTPINRYLILEWIATFIILWAWYTRPRGMSFDVMNFHIAYPNCTHNKLLRRMMGMPMVITEHWSAFNRKFSATGRGVQRIRRIFHQGIPLIVVSKALERDIAEFAGPPNVVAHIVDNAVDPNVFHPDGRATVQEGVFFTIAGWRFPKRPDVLIEALAGVRAMGLPARLRIAGTGVHMDSMIERITRLGLTEHVDLLGHLDEHQVADELRGAHALVHASDYETYSAVCAEALCCGTPVLASRVGGIPEFVGPGMGVLVATNEPADWVAAWSAAWTTLLNADRQVIAATMIRRAGIEQVGLRYADVLRSTLRTSTA